MVASPSTRDIAWTNTRRRRQNAPAYARILKHVRRAEIMPRRACGMLHSDGAIEVLRHGCGSSHLLAEAERVEAEVARLALALEGLEESEGAEDL
jgi:hypothetical protein